MPDPNFVWQHGQDCVSLHVAVLAVIAVAWLGAAAWIGRSFAQHFCRVQDSPELISVRLAGPNAYMPAKATAGSAGWDLCSAEPLTLVSGKGACIDTGVHISMPARFYGQIAPRSGLAAKYNVAIQGGVIDSDYRGSIKVLLFNHGDKDVEGKLICYQIKFCTVRIGDRIAQLIITCISQLSLSRVGSLELTTRGSKGFGSSGK